MSALQRLPDLELKTAAFAKSADKITLAVARRKKAQADLDQLIAKQREFEALARTARAELENLRDLQDERAARRLLEGAGISGGNGQRCESSLGAWDLEARGADRAARELDSRIEGARQKLKAADGPVTSAVLEFVGRAQTPLLRKIGEQIGALTQELIHLMVIEELQTRLIGVSFAIPEGTQVHPRGGVIARNFLANLPAKLRSSTPDDAALSLAAMEIANAVLKQINGAQTHG